MTYETIQFEMRGAVGIITLNRPNSLNALTTEVGQEFLAALNEARERGARAAVITGAGGRLCRRRFAARCRKIAKREGKVEAFFDEPLRLLNECIMANPPCSFAVYCRG